MLEINDKYKTKTHPILKLLKVVSILAFLLINYAVILNVNAQSESYPYAVSEFYEALKFNFWGDQIPLSIEISPNSDDPSTGTITYASYNQGTSRYVYPIKINNVATKTIEVTDYLGEVRNVNVNTEIIIQTSTQEVSIPSSYLFVNRNGSLALATTVPAYLTQTLPMDSYFELTQISGPILSSDYDISHAVNQADWTNDFYYNHVNMPTKVSVSHNTETDNLGSVTFELGERSVTYEAVFETIPQVDLRMESTLADVEPIRYIKANTRIRLSNPSSNDFPAELANDLFMFYNKKEGISLATAYYSSSGLSSDYDLKAEAVAQ